MKTIDNDDAGDIFAFSAAIDAQNQHKKYWSMHTSLKQNLAVKLKELAYDAYGLNGSKVYLNARKNFITIKIDKPRVSTSWNRNQQLNTMNEFVLSNNVLVVSSKNNLLFRIPK
jgi:hypothetical protein